jgi:transposase-like protein
MHRRTCCKSCGSTSVYRFGRSAVLNQRYKCSICEHTFTKYDGRTKLEKHKKRVALFFTHYEAGLSVKRISIFLKLKEKTVRNWIEKEEKAFEDDEYNELMTDYRDENYYYRQIRYLLDIKEPFDENFYYDNGKRKDKKQEKQKEQKEQKEESENKFEFIVINGIAIYSKEKVNENLNYVNEFLKEDERREYVERMNRAIEEERMVVVDSKNLNLNEVMEMLKGMSLMNVDYEKDLKIEDSRIERRVSYG